MLSRPVAVALGLLGDRLLGEPTTDLHPVSMFGRMMGLFEERLYRNTRSAGALYCATGVAAGTLAGALLESVALATCLAVGGSSLSCVAMEIHGALSGGDLERARELLPALVGRDPTGLDENEVARAVVESVAENTVDAVVAPVLWALAAGAPGALGYRALNTLDSMVGHRSARYARFGWASARLDDAAAWVPARVTALMVCLLRPAAASRVLHVVRTQARAHPSPNAGVAEGAFAAALGIRLGGYNRYDGRLELRAVLGSGRGAEPSDIPEAVRLSRDIVTGLGLALGLTGLLRAVPAKRHRAGGGASRRAVSDEADMS